jgi:hypothetical protein
MPLPQRCGLHNSSSFRKCHPDSSIELTLCCCFLPEEDLRFLGRHSNTPSDLPLSLDASPAPEQG